MTGDSPPIFAQSAGAEIVYIGQEPAKPESSAILVPAGSSICTLADLKGKKIAFTKGSSAHYLTVSALQKAGLSYADIQPVYLSPSEARAPRWSAAAWTPGPSGIRMAAAAQRAGGVRVLATGQGLTSNNTFYLAARKFARANPKVIDVVFQALTENDRQLAGEVEKVAATLSGYTGLDAGVYETMLERHPSYRVDYLTLAGAARAAKDRRHLSWSGADPASDSGARSRLAARPLKCRLGVSAHHRIQSGRSV